MIVFIASAKIMTGRAPEAILSRMSEPTFSREAHEMAVQLAACSIEQLQSLLHCNREIAAENWLRYQHFCEQTELQPASFAYDGMVFQKLAPETFSDSTMDFAQDHLLIGSFLYGLLRPLDRVHPYRLEGEVCFPPDSLSRFAYWKPLLTDRLIARVKADDGILVNLASSEFKQIFDWRRVAQEVRILTPEFKIEKEGRPKTIVIYTKMCRGAMTRWIMEQRPTFPEQLRNFTYEGYRFREEKAGKLLFVMES